MSEPPESGLELATIFFKYHSIVPCFIIELRSTYRRGLRGQRSITPPPSTPQVNGVLDARAPYSASLLDGKYILSNCRIARTYPQLATIWTQFWKYEQPVIVLGHDGVLNRVNYCKTPRFKS